MNAPELIQVLLGRTDLSEIATRAVGTIVMIILKDDHGDRCIWERDGTGMTMVMRTQRFTGEWP